MSRHHSKLLRIALPVPLRRQFDYLPPIDVDREDPQPGVRLRVPFGNRTLIGVLLSIEFESSIAKDKLKPALEWLDQEPLFCPSHRALCQWASRYYHHPIGEVLLTGVPARLRQGKAVPELTETCWRLTAQPPEGQRPSTRAPRQHELLKQLGESATGLTNEQLNASSSSWRRPMAILKDKGLVEDIQRPILPPKAVFNPDLPPKLNPAQSAAAERIIGSLGRFRRFLLDGITGSGKTEVYFQVIEQVLKQGQQVLLLIPEIGLASQIIHRVQHRFPLATAEFHSGLTNAQRLRNWLTLRQGSAAIMIGTRSAVWVPAQRLGLIIVDEEHDLSYKQQDGFRYSARDVAIVRAKQLDIPIVLGTATPCLESLYNVTKKRYQRLTLPQRAGTATTPQFVLLDVRGKKMLGGLSDRLLAAITSHLGKCQQVLLFINRRGYAPALFCHQCGWIARCDQCDANLTYHHASQRLRCHHCGSVAGIQPACPACQGVELIKLGQGTERIEETLSAAFPNAKVVRIDRDTTLPRGAMAKLLEQAESGQAEILIGTQMLAKGHHFPGLTLVGVIDADSQLFSTDLRATERLAQLLIQVAGRAGRAENPGTVIIQTHQPEHPLLRTLVKDGYHAFAKQALLERRATALPPYSSLALVRAESTQETVPALFLEHAKEKALQFMPKTIKILGPVPAPMQRRAGYFRCQLLFQSQSRSQLHQALDEWLVVMEKSSGAGAVHWSLDVDPQEMF